MIPYPNIDPVLFKLGFLEIRWYGLSYVLGLFLSFNFIKKPFLKLGVSEDQHANLMTYSILAVILGGRLGYTLFYNFSYYIKNPVEILFVWQGGMSYHGAAIGLMLSFIIYAKSLNEISHGILLQIACRPVIFGISWLYKAKEIFLL